MRGTEFLPVSREEMLARDWYYYDFLVVWILRLIS